MSSLIVNVCRVHKIEKHPNADRLSIVTINDDAGWNCIVSLDQYKVGDLVVYVPPDCIIPPNLIEKYNLEYLKHNGRTSSIKLRKYLSQGLILTIEDSTWKFGDNVAEKLGITKYEQPERESVSMRGFQPKKRALNPFFDKYTDIENIKNFTDIFEDGDEVCVTEKIHGSNIRFGYLTLSYDSRLPFIDKIKYLWLKYVKKETHQFVYGSHNVQLVSGSKNYYGIDVYGRIAKKYDLANKIPKDTIIYGEVYGKGIQDLTYGLDDIDVVVFDVKQNGKYLNWFDAVAVAESLGLKVVPVIHIGAFDKEKLLEWTTGKSLLCPTQIIEGCVVKPLMESNNPRLGRKILKSISPEYLTRKGGSEYK